MKIINIEAQQLRSMKKQEGLVIQGCGGDLKEWAEGINEMLAKSGILKNDGKFEKCFVFENEKVCSLMQESWQCGDCRRIESSEAHGYRIMYRTDSEDLLQNRKSRSVSL